MSEDEEERARERESERDGLEPLLDSRRGALFDEGGRERASERALGID